MEITRITRRSLLLSLLFGSSSLACWIRKKPRLVCPGSPAVSFLNGPLTIDTHCHVFNGTDLQVQKFISMVVVNQNSPLAGVAKLLGGVLEKLAWSNAPTGADELAALQKIAQQLASCSADEASERVAGLRQDAYGRGRRELQTAVNTSTEFSQLRDRPRAELTQLGDDSRAKADAARLIAGLPESAEAYRIDRTRPDGGALSLRSDALRGFLDFVLQNFQYRYVSVHDYLRSYNQPGTRVVDLLIPNLVDYDWWLAMGNVTPTSLSTQVEVMREIAILTGGRVHSFVPFDPLREVASELGHAPEGSFNLVKNTIEKEGFLGVKLYPPMGFAALGNADMKGPKGANYWARTWLPSWTDRDDLGTRLDAAMSKLFRWCEDNGVPVTAHTNQSNGVAPDLEKLAGPTFWGKALTAFPNLRVNFGHFGGASSNNDGLERARLFAQLMNAVPAGPGRFAYADAGFFAEVIGERPELLATLRTLYTETTQKGDAALAKRFMYGTDWEMTLTQGSVDAYLTDFIRLFGDLEQRAEFRTARLEDLTLKFFGGNAVNWLGLRKGDPARGRLDAFYRRNKVPTPDWMTKVDRSVTS